MTGAVEIVLAPAVALGYRDVSELVPLLRKDLSPETGNESPDSGNESGRCGAPPDAEAGDGVP